MQSRKQEALAFFKPRHQVHALYSISGSSLHQVVSCRKNQKAVQSLVNFKSNVAKVRPGKYLRVGIFSETLLVFYKPDKAGARICFSQSLPDQRRRQCFFSKRVDCAENPSDDIHGVRGHGDFDSFAG